MIGYRTNHQSQRILEASKGFTRFSRDAQRYNRVRGRTIFGFVSQNSALAFLCDLGVMREKLLTFSEFMHNSAQLLQFLVANKGTLLHYVA
jgi:hypothetical protein